MICFEMYDLIIYLFIFLFISWTTDVLSCLVIFKNDNNYNNLKLEYGDVDDDDVTFKYNHIASQILPSL